MTCRACAAYSRALFSGDEALAEAARDLGGPEDCQCDPVLPQRTNAADVAAIGESIAAEHDRMPRAMGSCGHVVTTLYGRGYCATCGGPYGSRVVEIAGPVPLAVVRGERARRAA